MSRPVKTIGDALSVVESVLGRSEVVLEVVDVGEGEKYVRESFVAVVDVDDVVRYEWTATRERPLLTDPGVPTSDSSRQIVTRVRHTS